jgi:cyclophilin family peptidyl-prolyl cis-trans isomerase
MGVPAPPENNFFSARGLFPATGLPSKDPGNTFPTCYIWKRRTAVLNDAQPELQRPLAPCQRLLGWHFGKFYRTNPFFRRSHSNQTGYRLHHKPDLHPGGRPGQIALATLAAALLLAGVSTAQDPARHPDGLYAEIRTSKGLITARLEADLTPMTVANFVGLAEGTIANTAFDQGRPFYDGSVYHRVVPGHVIQTGIPASDRARNPGYTFPNEIHARLSHDHAGALNMANSGPHTNAAQFCITLGDRSYLDGDFTVFGEVVAGLDVVMRIVQGDVVESVRILRVGSKAQAFHPTTESFQAQVKAAVERAAEHEEKKRLAEREWIARNYPKATGPADGVLTERLSEPAEGQGLPASGSGLSVRYRGTEVRYMGQVIGREGPPLETISFASGEVGVPGFVDPPQIFKVQPGKTKLNPGLDAVLAGMLPGERRVAIVPAAQGYGRAGLYPPEVPGQRRFVVSPNALLVYEVEVLGK